uniref:Uncharacterized protein n=1 Tax=Panstrongylus lignarius TaxID=156445 RepID=A0A224Y2K3_9HEMI
MFSSRGLLRCVSTFGLAGSFARFSAAICICATVTLEGVLDFIPNASSSFSSKAFASFFLSNCACFFFSFSSLRCCFFTTCLSSSCQ